MELGNRRKGLRGIISQESFNKRSSARYQVTTRLALAGRCEYPDFLGRGCKISIGWMLPAASLGMKISRNPWVRLQSISRILLRNKWLDIHLHYRTFLTAYLARPLEFWSRQQASRQRSWPQAEKIDGLGLLPGSGSWSEARTKQARCDAWRLELTGARAVPAPACC